MKVRETTFKYREVLANKNIVFAVSGGPDSLAMLLATQYLGARLKKKIVVAHFSHGLRPTEDEIERNLVRQVAENCGVKFTYGNANVNPSESAAREARYKYLAMVALEYDAIGILTAHTCDDQAETLLLRLVRGSGLKGVGSIREFSSRTIQGNKVLLLRPMLKITRAQTEAACLECDVLPARDKSNDSLRYARNRIRSNVIPELEKINIQAQAALVSFTDRASKDNEFLEDLAASKALEFETRTPFKVEWDKRQLRELPEPLLIRVLENSWKHLTGEGSTLGAQKIRQMIRVIQTSGYAHLGKKGHLANERGEKIMMIVSVD